MGKTIGRNFNITPPDVGARWLAAIATTACAALAGFSSSVYADTVGSGTQEVGGRLAPNSVTVSTSGNVLMDIVRNTNRTLTVGKSTVTVTTGAGGYQLYISGVNTGSNGYTSLYYDGDVNASSKIEGFAVDIPTAFAAANANQWGYAVSSDYVSGFASASNYNAAANAGTFSDTATINKLKWQGVSGSQKLIRTTASAMSNNTTDVYYGIYVNSADLMAGNYKNSVVYTAFVDGANTLNITPFAINHGGTMTITTEYQSSAFPVPDASRISVNLRDGNTSVGTCNNINIINGGNSDLLKFTCVANIADTSVAGKVLDVSVTVKMPNSNSELNYTAEDSWGYYIAMNGKTTMQEAATANACASVGKYSVTGVTYNLKDARTNQWYLVRKLEDGNCWMVQNLWLAANTTYTGSNGTATFSTGTSSSSGWKGFDTSGTQFYQGTHSDNTPDDNNNTGSFFAWKKATADTGGGYGQSDIVTNSVCPQGWKLPSGSSDGDFGELKTVYNNDFSSFSIVWSGSFIGYCNGDSCTYDRGSSARWWTSTQADNDYGHSMYIYRDPSAFGPSGNNKGLGYSVRCMLSGN